MPPSTTKFWPVKAASSDSKEGGQGGHVLGPADPARRVLAVVLGAQHGFAPVGLFSGLTPIQPGLRQLTRTAGPRLTARAWVRPAALARR